MSLSLPLFISLSISLTSWNSYLLVEAPGVFFFFQINSSITHIFIVILILGKRSTYGCYGVVGGDAMKINWGKGQTLNLCIFS